MKKVVIFGCGPAGLMAAAAVKESGMEPVIVSKKRRSEMFGAQYLHRPIPNYSPDEPFEVTYVLNGTPAQYKEKVYGLGYRGTVSPEDLSDSHSGWDIRTTYYNLWEEFEDSIINLEIEGDFPVVVARLQHEENVAHFISTIPAPALCVEPAHGFSAQEIWSIGDAPERGIFVPYKVADLNHVVCSGLAENSWYRAANIQGYNTIEWPQNKRPPLEGVAKVTKPLSTNCDCWPFLHRAGRYGKWQKGTLSHEAYYETLAGLNVVEFE